MPEWLKTEQFGMPRWIWLSLLGGGLALGLYLRSRSAPVEDVEGGEFAEGELATAGERQSGFVGGGVSGGAGSGSVVPVQSPFLPEGVVDVFGDLSTVTGELGDQLVAITTARDEAGGGAVTGGGPPKVPNGAHSPPPASDDRGCGAGDKVRLGTIRVREGNLRKRVQKIETQIRRARSQPNFRQNPKLKAKVRQLQGERRARVGEIRQLASERKRLVARCG